MKVQEVIPAAQLAQSQSYLALEHLKESGELKKFVAYVRIKSGDQTSLATLEIVAMNLAQATAVLRSWFGTSSVISIRQAGN
jgi:hypothetical protein